MDATMIKAMLGALPFNRHLGLEIVDAGVVVLPEGDHLKNHVGTQHAGALFTAGEAASGAAVIGALGDLLGTATPLAKEASIAYKKMARGRITAKASLGEPAEGIRERLARDGKTVFEVGVE